MTFEITGMLMMVFEAGENGVVHDQHFMVMVQSAPSSF